VSLSLVPISLLRPYNTEGRYLLEKVIITDYLKMTCLQVRTFCRLL
jgi:hypothetical protein